MIDQKLIPGRYIEFDPPAPTDTNHAATPPGFHPVSAVTLRINRSWERHGAVGPRPRGMGFDPTPWQKLQIAKQRAGMHVQSWSDRQVTSTVATGASTQANRNFVWLPVIDGDVTEVRPNGLDVLTGPMSGCWIVRYMRAGVRYVGHVCTKNTAADPLTIAVKLAWNNYAAAAIPGNIDGFNPFNDAWAAGAVPGSAPGEGARKYFALVTGADVFHTVIAYPLLAKPTRMRIAGIQNNPSTIAANRQLP